MKLYELVGSDNTQGFSPFVWRIKLALAHKNLNYELIPLQFTEIKDVLAFADSKTVPVLVDGDNVIKDSWDIACYLEETYTDRPSLFGGNVGRAGSKLLNSQIIMPLLAPLFRTLVADIHDILNDVDKDYFRSTREPRIGCTFEEARKNYKVSLAKFKKNLWSYNQYLLTEEYFSGEAPAYNDYILYSMFLWARGTSNIKLLDDDDPLNKWLVRMDQSFGDLVAHIKR